MSGPGRTENGQLVVDVVGGNRYVDTASMPPAVRSAYDAAYDRGNALYRSDPDAGRAAWKDADRIAEPYVRERKPKPPPTTASPPPPELIPDTGEAIAISLSPDVCRSPTKPVHYQVWGKADDNRNYSPNVRSNGQVLKHANSCFTTTYGDEPGVGLGVKSGTVGSVVTPVTSSPIVFVNGNPVQRHTDRCKLNGGNCPGEYSHQKSTQTHPAPDGNDSQDKAWYEHFFEGAKTTSETVEAGETAVKKAGEYWNDPSQAGRDAESLWDRVPTVGEAWQGTKDLVGGAARGAVHVGEQVINDPAGSAKAAAGWTKDQAVGVWNGTEKLYQEGGVAKVAGAAVGVGVEVFNPVKKAKTLKNGVEVLDEAGDLADAARKAKELEEAAKKAEEARKAEKAANDGEGGARSTAKKKPYSDPKSRPKYGDKQVDDVWEAAKDENGDVYDPNTGEKLEWDKSKSRAGQWDMGHKPGHEYRTLHRDYMDGRISKEEFLRQYRDPKNYQPESMNANRSHRYEAD